MEWQFVFRNSSRCSRGLSRRCTCYLHIIWLVGRHFLCTMYQCINVHVVCIHPSLLTHYNTSAFGSSLLQELFLLLTARIGGKSTVKDYELAAEACLPIINAILADVRNKRYPQKCFLNIDLPTDVLNHKVRFA